MNISDIDDTVNSIFYELLMRVLLIRNDIEYAPSDVMLIFYSIGEAGNEGLPALN